MEKHIDIEVESNYSYKRQVGLVLNKIINEQYMYSVDDLVDILKIQRIYIQKNICSELNNLELDTQFKLYVKAALGDSKAYERLVREYNYSPFYSSFKEANQDIANLAKEAKLDRHKLSRRILISRIQLRDFLLNFFSVENTDIGEDGHIEYSRLHSGDVDMILECKLENQAHLKEYYDVKTELQVYRRLAKGDGYVMRKYVVCVDNKAKRGLARYLVNRDETLESCMRIRECLSRE